MLSSHSRKEHGLRFRLIAVLAVLLGLVGGPALFAQESDAAPVEFYTMGQQSLQLSAGLFIPLFFQSFGGGGSPTNLTAGGAGALHWNVHLGNNFLVGLELSGSISRSPLENYLLMLPITIKGGYIFHIFPVEIPVSLGIGVNLIKYQTQSHADLILKPAVSPMWRYNSSWSFGLNIEWWWDFQFATGDQDSSQARMGHFLTLMPTVQYNF